MTQDDTIYTLVEEWVKSGKNKEMSFKDWLVEQGIDVTSLQ